MKIAKKLKGMAAIAMATITLATTVSSCSKDKGATPAQNTTETKKGLGMKVSDVSADGKIRVNVSGYDASQHQDVKIEVAVDDSYEDWTSLEKKVDVERVGLFEIPNLNKDKSYKVRLSYTIPGGGSDQTRINLRRILVNKYTAPEIQQIPGMSDNGWITVRVLNFDPKQHIDARVYISPVDDENKWTNNVSVDASLDKNNNLAISVNPKRKDQQMRIVYEIRGGGGVKKGPWVRLVL